MPFVTKVDYSDNRQIKQFILTDTTLSGTTQFGVPYDELPTGIDQDTIITTAVYVNVTSTFSGNSTQTTFFFGEPVMNVGVESLEPITIANSGETQTGVGYEGKDSTVIDGNTVYLTYTGSTYDLTVTSIQEVAYNQFTGTTISNQVNVLSGSSIDFKERTIWVDVKGITRTERLILTDELVFDNQAEVLARDSEGNVVGYVPSDNFVTGFSYNPTTNTFVIERSNELNDLSAAINAVSGFTVNGYLSATTINADTIFSGGTNLSDLIGQLSNNDYVTGSTFSTATGVLTSTRLSNNTFSVDLDGRYALDVHTHTVGDITDFPTNVSYFINDVGYITGFTDTNDYVTGATFSNETIEFTRLSGATFSVDLSNTYALTGHTHGEFDIWRKSDGVTPADSYTENILHGGDVTLSGKLNITTNAISGREFNLVSKVTDNSLDTFFIGNGTTTSQRYIPTFIGYTYGAYQSLLFRGLGDSAYDTAGAPSYVEFLAANTNNSTDPNNGVFTAPVNRTLFKWGTVGNTFFLEVLANGEVRVPLLTTTLIDNSSSGRVLVTREYLQSYTSSGLTDDYVIENDFNTSTGVLTSTRLSGGTFTVDLDGRYALTGHTHTVSDITDFPTNISYFNNDVGYITGFTDTNDYVTGATFSNEIIEFTRLSGATFNVDLSGTYALTGHTHTVSDITDFPTNVSYFNNDAGYITGFTDTNDYVTGNTFTTATGVLTSTRLSGGTFSVNLDGRYALTGHTHTVSDITDFPTNISYFNNDVGYLTQETNDYVTGATFSSEVIVFTRLSGATFSVDLSGTYALTGHTHTVSEITDFPSDVSFFNNDAGYLTEETNDYVTASTFNTTTGILTSTRLSGGTFAVDLDGRYALTGHTHTVSDITDFPTNISYFNNDVGYITGFTDTNDYVTGATFSNEIINFTRLSGATFSVDLSGTYALTGHTHTVSDITDFPTNVSYFNNDVGYITGFTDTNDYVTGNTFNTSNGVLTSTRLSGGTFSVDLDGRYALTAHTHTVSDITDFPTDVSYFNNDVGYLTGFTDNNDYVTGATFSSEVIIFTRLSGATFSVDLSNTYALTGHTHTISDITDFPSNVSFFNNDVGYITGFTDTNDYVISNSFNTSTGILTSTRLSGDTFAVDLDGRYALTGHTHTVSDITDFPTDVSYFNNDVGYITGFTDTNDYVTGATFSGEIIEFTRLSGTTFTVDLSGTYALTGHTHTVSDITDFPTNVSYFNNDVGYLTEESDDYVTGSTFNTSTGVLTSTRLSGGTFSVDLDGRYTLTGHTHTVSDITDFPTDVSYFNNDVGYITGFTDTNDYVTGATFSSEVIVFTRLSGATFSVDLSDTYALTGHTHTVSDITDFPTNISYFNNDVGYITGFTDTNDYVTASTFNTTTGVLTSTRLSGGTFAVDLDGRYALTGHTHTVSDITDFPTNVSYFANDVGYLTQETNDYVTGATFINEIIEFTRLSGATFTVDLSNTYALTGHTHTVSDITDFPTDVSYFNNDAGYITGFTDNNDYVTGATFSTGTGLLISTRLSGGTFSVDLDGRYALTGHTHTVSDITDFPTNISYFNNDAGYLTQESDDYVTGATFSNEIIQFTRLSGATFNVDLSGTYALTGHTHTVSDITDFPTNVSYFNNDVGYITEESDDYVTGATFSSEVITFARLSGATFSVDLSGTYALTGHTHTVSDITDFPTNVSYFNNDAGYLTSESDDYVTGATFSSEIIQFTRLSGATFSVDLSGTYALTGHTHTVSDITDFPTNVSYFNNDVGYITEESDDYVTGSTFNTTNGDLTSTRLSGATFTVNLDGRYALTGHTHTVSDITDFPTNVSYFNNDAGYLTEESDDYVTGATFSSEVITFTRLSGATFSVDLSNTYALTGHTHTVSDITDFPTNVSYFNNDAGYLTQESDDYVTGATFSSEIIEFTRLSGATFTVDLSGTYALTGHTHTVSDITDFPTNVSYFNNDAGYLTQESDDYVTGATFTNEIIVFSRLSGATFSVDLSGTYALSGHTHTVSDITDFPTNVSYFNNDAGYLTQDTNDYVTGATFSNQFIEFTRLSGGTFNVDLSNTYALTGHTHFVSDITNFPTNISFFANDVGYLTEETNDYVTGSTFNTSNGDLTSSRLSGGTFTVNLDGRYALTGHTHTVSDITDFPTNVSYFNNDAGYLTEETNDYVTGATFSSEVITFTRLSGATFSVDLSGTYALTGHTHTVSDITDFPTNVSYFNNDAGYLTEESDDYVTGATLNDETIEFTRLSGATFSVDISPPLTPFKETTSTGIVSGGTLSINSSDNTEFDVSSGRGYIVNHLPEVPIITEVVWPTITGIAVTNLTTRRNTQVAININGDVIQQADFTNEELRSLILLGGIDHSSQVDISNTFSVQKPMIAPASSVSELADALGIINRAGNVYSPNSAGNLTINKSFGSVFSYGTNNNININNPHSLLCPSLTALTFQYVYDDGNGVAVFTADRTEVDPDNYDDGSGTLAPVPSNNWTVQRILLFPSTNDTYIQYSVDDFNLFEDAVNFASSLEFPALLGLEDTIVRGYIIVREGETDLTSSNTLFLNANKFGLVNGAAGASAVAWGDITGAIENQIDLQIELGNIVSGITVTGITTKTITLEKQNGSTISASFTDDKVTGTTFNTANGDLTLTTVLGNNITENLDGRYALTTSEQKDDYVTGATFSNEIIEFTRLSGATFSVDLSGTYALTGHTHTVSDITDFPSDLSYFNNDVGYITGFTDTNDYVTGATFSNETIQFTRLSGATFTVDLSNTYALTGHTHTVSDITDFPTNVSYFNNDVGYITGFTDTNDYVTGATFVSEVIEFTRLSGATFTVDLSGVYTLIGHTHTISNITDFPTNVSFFTNDAGYLTEENDDYVTGMTFNTSDGNLSLSTLSGSTVTENLDGRYALQANVATSTWQEITTTAYSAAEKGKYIANNNSRVVFTLPTTNNFETIRITGKGAGGWQVDVPSGWVISFAGVTVTGNLQSDDSSDTIELLAIGDNIFRVISSIGNITYVN